MTKQPWNKNKSVGQKKPFTPRQVEMLKEILKERVEVKELALVNLAATGVFPLKHLLEMSAKDAKAWCLCGQLPKPIWEAVLKLIIEEQKAHEDFLFTAHRKKTSMTVMTYRILIKKWCRYLGLDPKDYGTSAIIKSAAGA